MSTSMSRVLLVTALFGCSLAQYSGYDRGYSGSGGFDRGYDNGPAIHSTGQYNAPKVAIINHKQAQGTDGSFNYAFNAENGIHQGEHISPDGSRQGSYSYVDPSGKTVSLKYVADKAGFRVLEGDHVPRPVPLPAQHAAAYQAAAAAHAEAAHRNGVGSAYHRQQPYSVDESDNGHYSNYRSGDDGSYRSSPADEGSYSGAYNSAAEDVHTGPHSFGNGFAFEFGGNKY